MHRLMYQAQDTHNTMTIGVLSLPVMQVVVAVCDPSDDALDAAKQQLGAPLSFSNYADRAALPFPTRKFTLNHTLCMSKPI